MRIVNGGLSMILPTGTTVAVADGETMRLFHNTGVKPGVHLVEITAAPPAPAHSGSGSRHHTRSANTDGGRLGEGRLRGDDGRVSEQAQPGRDYRIPGRCVRSQDPGGDAQALPRDLRDKIIGELAKDFSRRPLEDISSLIADA